MKRLDGIINSVEVSLSKLRWIVKDREAWHTTVHGVARLSHQTTIERIDSRLVFEWGCDAFHHSDLNLVTTRCLLQVRRRSKGICIN